MERTPRRRFAMIFVVPLIISLASASRLGRDIRTVEFLQIFASGMLFGVGVMGLVQVLRKGGQPTS